MYFMCACMHILSVADYNCQFHTQLCYQKMTTNKCILAKISLGSTTHSLNNNLNLSSDSASTHST